MRILHVSHYFLPHQGGEERYVYYLGQELVRAGHEVWVLTSSLPGCLSMEIMDGIKVIRHQRIATILRNPITPGMLLPRNYLRRFDLIHAQGEYSFTTNAAVFLKRYYHLPLVMTCYGRAVFGNFFADAVERLYSATIGKIILKNANRIIALSLSTKQRLQASGINGNKIAVIPTSIDLAKWAPQPNQDISGFLSKYHLDRHKIILFTGALAERKGVKYLIRALPEIIENNSDVVCLFVGDGDYRKNAERLVSELKLTPYVRFTGRVTDEELALAYKSCQVYVLPSLFEQAPATILEAFAFSKPVIATDIDGVKDYFKDVALLIPPQSSDELASAIIKVLDNPELAGERGRRGRNLIESNFTWQHHVEEVLKLYQEVRENKMKFHKEDDSG